MNNFDLGIRENPVFPSEQDPIFQGWNLDIDMRESAMFPLGDDALSQDGQEEDNLQARIGCFALPVVQEGVPVAKKGALSPFASRWQAEVGRNRSKRRIDWLACPRSAYIDFAVASAFLSKAEFIQDNKAMECDRALLVPRGGWSILALEEPRSSQSVNLFRAEEVFFGILICMYGQGPNGCLLTGMAYADGNRLPAIVVSELVQGMELNGVELETLRTYLVGGRMSDGRNQLLGSLQLSKDLIRETIPYNLCEVALHMNEGIGESITVVMKTDRIEYSKHRA